MACLWMENSREQTLEQSYTQMREDEVFALRKANAELRHENELLREELWKATVGHLSATPATASAKSSPTPASAVV